MSAVLHPEGPEEPRTYWMRRGISVGVVVLLVLIVALIWPRGDGAQTAAPAASESAADPKPAAAPTTAAPSAITRTPSKASPTPAEASKSAKAKPSKAGSSKAKPSKAKPSKSAKAASGRQACSPKDLSVSVSGPKTVRAAKAVKLNVTVTNKGSEDCEAEIDQDNFELRVFSGSDKIFTTDHCRKWAPTEAEMLAAGEKLKWTTSWGVVRTAKDCKTTKQLLQPGTYVATAELDKAKPAQHVMRLK